MRTTAPLISTLFPQVTELKKPNSDLQLERAKHVSASILNSAEKLGLFDQQIHIYKYKDNKRVIYLQLKEHTKRQGWQLSIIDQLEDTDTPKQSQNHAFLFKNKKLIAHRHQTDPYTVRLYDADKFYIASAESASGIADALLYSYMYDLMNEKCLQHSAAVEKLGEISAVQKNRM